jgi:hypothetical protein
VNFPICALLLSVFRRFYFWRVQLFIFEPPETHQPC